MEARTGQKHSISAELLPHSYLKVDVKTVITLAMSCLQLFECSQTAVCWFCLCNISGKGAKNEKVGLGGTPPIVPGLRINQ